MKNLVIAIIFTISLAAVSFGQDTTDGVQGFANRPTGPIIAVLEFTSETGVISANGTQTLQNGIVDGMEDSEKGKWIEIPSTGLGAQTYLDVLGRPIDPAFTRFYQQYLGRQIDPVGAAEIGRILGVDYVLVGFISGDRGPNVQTQLIKTGTGTVVFATQARYSGATHISNGTVETTDRAIKPVIQKLTASLKAADL